MNIIRSNYNSCRSCCYCISNGDFGPSVADHFFAGGKQILHVTSLFLRVTKEFSGVVRPVAGFESRVFSFSAILVLPFSFPQIYRSQLAVFSRLLHSSVVSPT